MAEINKFYIQSISAQMEGYRANWEPNKPIEIGDIGIIENGVFSVFTSLQKQNINQQVRIDTTKGDLKLTTKKDVSISAKIGGAAPIAGSALTDVDAGVSISFSSENAFVFEALGTKTHILENVFEIEKVFIDKAKADSRWKDFVVITEIIEADSLTLILSGGKNNVVDLKAKADANLANVNLANIDLCLSIVSEKISTENIIAKEGVKPIYKAMGLRHPLFGKQKLGTKSIMPEPKQKFGIQKFKKGEV